MALFLYKKIGKDGTKMAKKKKNALPSGSIRVQVYDYTDAEGKKHYKSFTAPTKKQAQARAADWKANKNKAQVPDGQWYVKQPKTYGSYREIEYPDFVIKKISHSHCEVQHPGTLCPHM